MKECINKNAFYVSAIDVDECASGANGSLICSQICVNDPGTFHCDCYSGYTTNSDMITCSGKGHALEIPIKQQLLRMSNTKYPR